MIPGFTTKLSERTASITAAVIPGTIQARADLIPLFGTEQINNITPRFGGFSGFILLLPVNGDVVLGTSGNIVGGGTALSNRVTLLVYSKIQNKWYLPNNTI